MEEQFTFDKEQTDVIGINGGHHLVLAPPGCGKTQILSERIFRAAESGVPFSDMLCLTFTNRASRNMRLRIIGRIGRSADELYIGNIHRFCARFLFENGIVPSGTSIMDELDMRAVLLTLCNSQPENDRIISAVMKCNNPNKKTYSEDDKFFARDRLLKDIQQMECITKRREMGFAEELTSGDSLELEKSISGYCKKVAGLYSQRKRTENLLDFDDLLTFTFNALVHPESYPDIAPFKKYRWVQVDEVQDLNPLQMAIVDRLVAPDDSTVLYLGDEQQAIFSFMGAKMATLEKLKKKCKGNIHHLGANYRSPEYLLDIYNEYAANILHVDRRFLPISKNLMAKEKFALYLKAYGTEDEEFNGLAEAIQYYGSRTLKDGDDGRTAVIVSTNKAADRISEILTTQKVGHIKVSGVDIFQSPAVKMLMAHLSILNNELNIVPWLTLLTHGKGADQSPQDYQSAADFFFSLKEKMLIPSDFLRYRGSSYVAEFCNAYRDREIVLFDTETTGLDTENDDIVQIAAVKIKNGEIIENSFLDIILKTDRPIPEFLGNIPNPLLKEYSKRKEKLSREDGLARFMEYVGDDVLLGHNVGYDFSILKSNLKRTGLLDRYAPDSLPVFDTLKLARIVKPDLSSYKLVNLLKVLELEGENSHLASDDILATKSLADFCYRESVGMIGQQKLFMSLDGNRQFINRLRNLYGSLYGGASGESVLAGGETLSAISREMTEACRKFMETKAIAKEPEKFGYIIQFIEHFLRERVPDYLGRSLKDLLEMTFMDISTLKESDFIDSGIIGEKVIIITVHKAKGLEFDNVIVTSVNDDRYPSYLTRKKEGDELEQALAEDARKLYVAMSRARKRLCLTLFCTNPYRQQPICISRFISRELRKHFHIPQNYLRLIFDRASRQ